MCNTLTYNTIQNMSTKTMSATIKSLGQKQLNSSWEHDNVHDAVESWNWNLSIFEIYDLVKEWNNHDMKNTLVYAYHYFGKDSMMNELHSFLIGWGVEDD